MTALLLLLSCGRSLAPEVQAAPDQAAAEAQGYDARLSTLDYALPVQVRAFSSQGQDLEMAYVYLPPQEGQAVLTLLHGKNFNADYWAPTAAHLQAQGYGVLMPDQVGFGKSSKPVDYQWSFAAMASQTRDLQLSLGIEQSIVVGHSMGGMLATRFALLYPEQTTQLLLVNPIGLENYLEHAGYKDVGFFLDNERKKTPESLRAYQQKNYYDGQWTPEYEALIDIHIGWMKGPDAEQIAQVNARTYDMIFTQPVVTELEAIQVPTTLILGTRDRTGPGRGWQHDGERYELGRYDLLGEQVVARIPQATLIELEGLGHLPQVEDFERYSQALDQALAQ